MATEHIIYLSSLQKEAHSLSVAIGLLEYLKKKYIKVALFSPIVDSFDDINCLREYHKLIQSKETTYLYTLNNFKDLIANGQIDDIIKNIITHTHKLKEEYDFILILGVSKDKFNFLDFDINLKIAKNLNCGFMSVIDASSKNEHSLYDEVLIENQTIKDEGCSNLGIFLNKLDFNFDTTKVDFDLYTLPKINEIYIPTVNELYKNLDCKIIFGETKYLNKPIRQIEVAAMGLNNFLGHIELNDLIITPFDRYDIILGTLSSVKSKQYKNVSAILLSGVVEDDKTLVKLLDNYEDTHIVILSTSYDTYTSAKLVDKIDFKITSKSYSKIALILGNFYKNIDTSKIKKHLIKKQKNILTPIMFEYKLFQKASRYKKHIVLPESQDDRILRAVEILLFRDVVNITLLGDSEIIKHRALSLGLNIKKANIINPANSNYLEKFSTQYFQMRKSKGILLDVAFDIMKNDKNYFATMMVYFGYADGMVSGAIGTTANTVRPALQIIKTKENIDIVSSIFFMCLDTKVLVYGDCAINQNPDEYQLAQIAISSANTAKQFGIKPKIAMLSYSTGTSGSGEDVTRVKNATNIVKNLDKSILIDGPLQYDTAIDKIVASKKSPNSKIAGDANILIFPDLNTGNNTYKAVQRSSGAIAIGPILQGLKKPVNDLSRGCLVADIINTVVITAIQANR